MAAVIFQGEVLDQLVRVVDGGSGTVPRIVVEIQQSPDAMGGRGWSNLDPIPRETLEQLLIASGVIT